MLFLLALLFCCACQETQNRDGAEGQQEQNPEVLKKTLQDHQEMISSIRDDARQFYSDPNAIQADFHTRLDILSKEEWAGQQTVMTNFSNSEQSDRAGRLKQLILKTNSYFVYLGALKNLYTRKNQYDAETQQRLGEGITGNAGIPNRLYEELMRLSRNLEKEWSDPAK